MKTVFRITTSETTFIEVNLTKHHKLVLIELEDFGGNDNLEIFMEISQARALLKQLDNSLTLYDMFPYSIEDRLRKQADMGVKELAKS